MMVEARQADHWAEACANFRVANQEGEFTDEELATMYPGLDEDFACNWVIAAMPRADWNRLDAYMNATAHWTADMVAKYRYMQDRLNARAVEHETESEK